MPNKTFPRIREIFLSYSRIFIIEKYDGGGLRAEHSSVAGYIFSLFGKRKMDVVFSKRWGGHSTRLLLPSIRGRQRHQKKGEETYKIPQVVYVYSDGVYL